MKKILLFSLGLLATSLLFSQNRNSLPNTLLWKITGKDLKKPSYLFGTMHILCADDAKLSDSLKKAIHDCDEIYFEIDLGDIAGMIKSMKFMQMADSKKLSDLLNKDDYAKVKSYFEKQSGAILPFSMLERFKPLLISSLIEENDLDCKTTNGMELVIMKESRAQNKKINGLETAEFQAGLFDSIPYEKQAHDLVNYIDSASIYKKMTTELADVYRRQDLGKIEELTVSGDATISNYLDLLLYGRNRRWADSLQSSMPQKSLVIAVGAGHLPGEQGMINLLRKKGYEVSPVKN